jgi:hypothetical protein
MNSTPAPSRARRTARSFAVVIIVASSVNSARLIVATLIADEWAKSSAVHRSNARASLLWRLRRIIAIETDLFAIQAEILHGRRREAATAHGLFTNQTQSAVMRGEDDRLSCSDPPLSARELTYCFLRLGNLDNGAFERLGRYNAALWKQAAQTLLLLGPTRRR